MLSGTAPQTEIEHVLYNHFKIFNTFLTIDMNIYLKENCLRISKMELKF